MAWSMQKLKACMRRFNFGLAQCCEKKKLRERAMRRLIELACTSTVAATTHVIAVDRGRPYWDLRNRRLLGYQTDRQRTNDVLKDDLRITQSELFQ